MEELLNSSADSENQYSKKRLKTDKNGKNSQKTARYEQKMRILDEVHCSKKIEK